MSHLRENSLRLNSSEAQVLLTVEKLELGIGLHGIALSLKDHAFKLDILC